MFNISGGELRRQFGAPLEAGGSGQIFDSAEITVLLKERPMINGAHVILFSRYADADRWFLRDVLGLSHVDAGHGWLIFALPPSEVALHPAEGASAKPGGMLGGELYLMCDDLKATMKSLEAKKVKCGAISMERWGMRTTIQLPSGGEIGLYEPSHKTALGLKGVK